MDTPNDRFNVLITNIQGIASDLLDFAPYVPNAATIPELVSELYAINASLWDLHTASIDPRNVHDARYYADAKWAVVEALKRTLQDLDRFIRKKDQRSNRTRREIYLSIWTDLNLFFLDQSNNTLFDRLNCFKLFLQDLALILKGDRESLEFHIGLDRIDNLLKIQDEDISIKLRHLEFEKREIEIRRWELERNALAALLPKAKSWERRRPENPPPPVAPQVPPVGGHRNHPAEPDSPPGPGRLWDTVPNPLNSPNLPSPPASVLSTTSPSVDSSPSCVVSNMPNHWSRKAFTQDRPATAFYNTSAESCLFGDHISGVTSLLRKKDYAELLILRFDNRVHVRIYIREKDRKARIYCKMETTGGQRIVSCRSVTDLYIHRQDSNLQLYEFDEAKKRRMWLILRFPNYERMILFFCAFLALKRDDKSVSNSKPDDHILPKEKHVFSCSIYDNHYRHALQIFKDESSDGIRLQASILKGEKKTAPIWTAFINYKIAALKWIRRVESRKIHLADLPRYVFADDYKPHVGPNGEYELQFDEAADADKFMKVIEDLAEYKI